MKFDMSKATRTGVPEGQHVATIIEAETRDTKAGDGKYVWVKWRVESGATFPAMYTIVNNNPTAVNIGLSQLGDIFEANGKGRGEGSTEELVGMKCLLTTKTDRDAKYGDKVKVVKHEAAGASSEDVPF